MRQIHERMPVILEPEAWSAWLDEGVGNVAELMASAGDDI
jgi:putative SOS response-associated peptidase YedK